MRLISTALFVSLKKKLMWSTLNILAVLPVWKQRSYSINIFKALGIGINFQVPFRNKHRITVYHFLSLN